jgi:hypothetical protein
VWVVQAWFVVKGIAFRKPLDYRARRRDCNRAELARRAPFWLIKAVLRLTMKITTLACSLAALALAVIGCDATKKFTLLGVHLQTPAQLPESQRTVVVVRNPPLSVAVDRFPELREVDLESARAVKTPTRKQLVLQFDNHGRQVIENFTTERRGELYVLTLNTVPIAAPAIRETIRDGRLVIDLDLPDEEIDKLVEGLNAAAKDDNIMLGGDKARITP